MTPTFRVDIFETKNARTPRAGTLYFATFWEAVSFGESIRDRFSIHESDHPVNATYNDGLKLI